MANLTVVNGLDFRDLVFVSGAESSTDTFKVAQAFGKDHKDVLRKTRSVISHCSTDFAQRNFTLCHENSHLQNGKPQPFYRMTKDGWTMLVFSFTGKAAVAFKEAYIAAFNWMTSKLMHQHAMGEQMQHRFAIKESRSKLKGTIGSRLMNERKKEKRVLSIEERQIMDYTNQDMIAIMNGYQS